MINIAAIRMQQFGVQFYEASLMAEDIDKLVRFEVLSYGESGQPPVRGGVKKTPSKVNWIGSHSFYCHDCICQERRAVDIDGGDHRIEWDRGMLHEIRRPGDAEFLSGCSDEEQ